MTEFKYNEIFELVLYFKRRVVVKPSEPNINTVMEINPLLATDDVLDLYSDIKNQYLQDMARYNMMKDDSIISDYIIIVEDDTFVEKIKEFESNPFFIEWDLNSKRVINSAFVKILK